MLDNCMVMLVRCFVLLGTWQAKAKHIASEYPENGNRLLGMVGYSLKMKQDLRDNITRWIIYPCVKGNAINLCTDLEPLTQRTSWIWFIEAAICHLEFYEEFTLVILRLWITHTWSHSWNKMPFKKITRCEQLTSKGPHYWLVTYKFRTDRTQFVHAAHTCSSEFINYLSKPPYTTSGTVFHSACHPGKIPDSCLYSTEPRHILRFLMQNWSSSPSPVIRRISDHVLTSQSQVADNNHRHCPKCGVWWP